jgi:hypothetical protein
MSLEMVVNTYCESEFKKLVGMLISLFNFSCLMVRV